MQATCQLHRRPATYDKKTAYFVRFPRLLPKLKRSCPGPIYCYDSPALQLPKPSKLSAQSSLVENALLN